MNKEEMFISVMLAAVSGWIAALGRELKNERRRLNWKLVALETPSAISCGVIGGGIAIMAGWTHPLAIAACASIAGHIGSAVMMAFIINWLKKRAGNE
jgi:hypothetical protein